MGFRLGLLEFRVWGCRAFGVYGVQYSLQALHYRPGNTTPKPDWFLLRTPGSSRVQAFGHGLPVWLPI